MRNGKKLGFGRSIKADRKDVFFVLCAWHDDSPLVRVVLFLDRGEGEGGILAVMSCGSRAEKERRHNVLWIAWGGGTNWRIRSDEAWLRASARPTLLGVKLNLNLESIKVKKSTWALLIE